MPKIIPDSPCDEVLVYASATTRRRQTKVWWSSLTPPATVDVFGETLVLIERHATGAVATTDTPTAAPWAEIDATYARRRAWHARRAS